TCGLCRDFGAGRGLQDMAKLAGRSCGASLTPRDRDQTIRHRWHALHVRERRIVVSLGLAPQLRQQAVHELDLLVDRRAPELAEIERVGTLDRILGAESSFAATSYSPSQALPSQCSPESTAPTSAALTCRRDPHDATAPTCRAPEGQRPPLS